MGSDPKKMTQMPVGYDDRDQVPTSKTAKFVHWVCCDCGVMIDKPSHCFKCATRRYEEILKKELE